MTIQEQLGEEWWEVLKDEFSKEYLQQLAAFISYKRKSLIIYPDKEDTFRAFRSTPFSDVKVVIIGQDPYHNGKADGLAFSYKDGLPDPVVGQLQSLDMVWREMERDVQFGLYLSFDYDLSWLAEQGVLLLNTILTVYKGKPNSHKKFGWQKFTAMAIKELMEDERPKVFMLWGKEAQDFFKKIETHFMVIHNHLILTAPHPASDLYKLNKIQELEPDYPNTFAGCGHFSKCNEYLKENKIEQIRW